ncbi:Cytochrome b5 reductase 4 [Hondaea fermentalgiana]|uniref:Cytochrome b5 reductase 4 n=1 Tax=Hondaea fermentalgiana TaxID=2315210 RepID=A0A2R5GBV1_9STRA|nr:Cytochrome b5 reductase 4 [Hondaea fermentalgiana]|eukprot:GBG28486.1 Cytochrome b5 reductase 4 [Hondaea fermentalgiana]
METMVTPAPKRGGGGRVHLGPGFSQLDWFKLAVHASDPAGRNGAPLRPITMAELRAHNSTRTDFWMALRGKVYNVTKYVPYHPGGADELARALGEDATLLFDEVHPWVSESMINSLEVGWLVDGDENTGAAASSAKASNVKPPASRARLLARAVGLSGNRGAETATAKPRAGPTSGPGESNAWLDCSLVSAEPSDTKHCFWIRVRVDDLAQDAQKLLATPGVYVKLLATIGEKKIERPFTPLLSTSTLTSRPACEPGEIDMLIKLYEDGMMTAHLAGALADGNALDGLKVQLRSAPYRVGIVDGRFAMAAYGAASFRRATPDVRIKHVCMIAQGTGVMPFTQLLDAASTSLESSTDEEMDFPTFSMLLASRTLDEAPLHEELAASDLLQDSLELVLSEEDNRITESLLNLHLEKFYGCTAQEESSSAPGLRIVVCGSFFFAEAMQKVILKAGWPSSCVIILD